MLYRFFIVLLPLCWFLYPLITAQRWGGQISLSVALALALTPVQLIKPLKKKWGLAAEETFYKVKEFYPLELDSRYAQVGYDLGALQEVVRELKGPTLRVAVDCVGMIGYYADVRVFDLFGLTSPRVAHKPLKRRGRPGHEKYGTIEDAIAEGSTLSTADLWRRYRLKGFTEYHRVRLGRSWLHFLRYDSATYDLLKRSRAALEKRGVKLRLPLTPHQAARRVKRIARRGPKPKLVQFLKRFYGATLAQEPELRDAIRLLERAKRPTKRAKASQESSRQEREEGRGELRRGGSSKDTGSSPQTQRRTEGEAQREGSRRAWRKLKEVTYPPHPHRSSRPAQTSSGCAQG